MRFSVVIPTLDRPEMLEGTLRSLERCDPAPDEIVVVDGDEKRSAEAVVRKVAAGSDRWRYLTGPRGSSHQRNVGIAAATGDVIVFSDDDVSFDADVFATLSQAYEEPDVVGATTKVIEAADNKIGRKGSPWRRLLPGGEEGTFTSFGYPRYITRPDAERDVQFMPGCFMSARAQEARRVLFDERLSGYALAEDEDFSYRLSRLGRVVYRPTSAVHHLKTGFASSDRRAFSRKVVVNRRYLFEKNFPQTPSARAGFFLYLVGLMLHRLVNRDWEGFRGVIDGIREVRRS